MGRLLLPSEALLPADIYLYTPYHHKVTGMPSDSISVPLTGWS